MALPGTQKKTRKQLDDQILAINTVLREIYTNKSSDEFRMKGDITKSPSYNMMEKSIADLSSLRGFQKKDADDLKQMFTTLHLPVFKNMVKEYILEMNERNTLFTTLFTVGYRFLIGELARIFSSTEATPKGIVYKPDKNSRKESSAKLIHLYNQDIEKTIDKYIQDINRITKDKKTTTESYTLNALGIDNEIVQEGLHDVAKGLSNYAGKIAGVSMDIGIIAGSVALITGLFTSIYGLFRGFNPVADINYLMMDSYEKKIRQFNNVSRLYAETKAAYEEYMQNPEDKRKDKVVKKYEASMEKYNIQMKNLSAQIEHFNQRAVKEAEEKAREVGKQQNDAPKSSSGKDDSAPKNDNGGDDDIEF